MNSEDSSLVTQQRGLSYSEIERISKAFVASGMFGRSVDRMSIAITKIMAGQELGLAPFASMRAVHVIDGNATLSANTMAAMVKSSNCYDYTVKAKTAERCEIEFYELRGGKRIKLGTETFDTAEAKTAGLLGKTNWQKYPKAMLFARCMSNGVRSYCPDIFNGMAVYTPEELETTKQPARPEAVEAEIVEPTVEPVDDGLTEDEQPAVDNDPLDVLDEGQEQETISAPRPAPGEERAILTDELKAEIDGKLALLGLTTHGEQRYLKLLFDKPFKKSLSENDWFELDKSVRNVLDGKEALPDDWYKAAPADHMAEENAA